MEIIMLLAILWMMIALDKATGQEAWYYPLSKHFICSVGKSNYLLLRDDFGWAEKLVTRVMYSLNNIISSNVQKLTQTTHIYIENPMFQG
ncbi:hypothetical protein [Falsiporphyromonas endometrii]|uniref:Uncharacterized protein n=1 Tax=Falsiporphyromonas endometrii TaxID=1387297 RepID=A0ABV9K9H5_9PORP